MSGKRNVVSKPAFSASKEMASSEHTTHEGQ
jgi:hypothetical protein